ncbi:DUF3846 domain-containing protein [Parablautia sp. Marseille-Q6255]|uniref:DUF3846 domain-containing protein n=1 Tax=Parablautia sp. Marseille-Q6255 TaxID=3039593 RepID=UPI0024BC8F0C|nr:hypothetical protein [Parablautia sp. Marseille-Q6255]
MKMIKITTQNEIFVLDFPEGNRSEQNKILRNHIGPECEYLEHVMARRLYGVLGASNRVTSAPGECVSMLIDEEGLLHKLPVNPTGSYLYMTDIHGCPIVGNILIIGEVYTGDGIDFCGMSDDQFNRLYPKLKKILEG